MVHLLRHGETKGFVDKRLHGRTDVALTEYGHAQMQNSITGQHWDVVVSSPLQRCALFAKKCSSEMGSELEIWPSFQEFYFGRWEGQSVDALCSEYGERYLDFFRDPIQFPAPGGEGYSGFKSRVLSAWQKVRQQWPGSRVLIVTHGGPIRVVLGEVKSLGYAEALQLNVPHAGLYRVR